jgi:hypothetical protein
MDYKKHYDLLIKRAKTRQLTGYVERHHIVPRCIGGLDDRSNLVELTPEEHYVAHQLLVKIYPDIDGLVYAVSKMTVSSKTVLRNNKLYGWVRRKHQSVCKKRVGKKNPSYGRSWYYNPDTLENGKFLSIDIPTGWVKGRTPKVETKCEVCGSLTGSYMARFCDKHRLEHKNTYSHKGGESYRKRKNDEDREKFTYAITSSKTWKEAIKKAGFKTDGYSRTRLQRFAKDNNISLMAD